jgi:hypothetical protein
LSRQLLLLLRQVAAVETYGATLDLTHRLLLTVYRPLLVVVHHLSRKRRRTVAICHPVVNFTMHGSSPLH